jgi:phosphotriesterase-related protein
MLGHDYAPLPVLNGAPVRPAAETRYLFVSNTALPALRAQGVAEETIDLMMREVPRRFLSGSR